MGQTVIRVLLMNPRRSYQAEPKPDKRPFDARVPQVPKNVRIALMEPVNGCMGYLIDSTNHKM